MRKSAVPSDTLLAVLEPGERAMAAILAGARGDDLQVARLVRTCPRRTYTQRDADFTDRLDLATRLGCACVSVYRQAQATVDSINVIRDALEELVQDCPEGRPLLLGLDEAVKAFSGHIAANVAAFDEAARDRLGVGILDVLAFAGWKDLAHMRDLLSGGVADRAEVERMSASIREALAE